MTIPYFESALVAYGNPATLDTAVTLIDGSIVPVGFSSAPETLNITATGAAAGSGFISQDEFFENSPEPGPFSIDNDGTIDADLVGQTLSVEVTGILNEADGLIEAQFGADLMIGATLTYSSQTGVTSQTGPFLNKGTILGIGAEIDLIDGFTNAGTITTTDGTLDLGENQTGGTASPWTNTGTIRTKGTLVELNGHVTTAGVGTLDHVGGSLMLLGTLDNTGAVVDTTQGTFAGLGLQGGVIEGGTLIVGPDGQFASSYGTLQDVTIQGGLRPADASGAALTLTGLIVVDDAAGSALAPITLGASTVLTLEGSADIGSSLSPTSVPTGDTTLVETGGIVLDGGTLTLAYSPVSTVLTLDAGLLVSGNGSLGNFENETPEIENRGHIDADTAQQTLAIDVPTFINDGTLSAENDAILQVGSFGQASAVQSVQLAADGSVVATNATVELSSGFSNAGIITVTDGTLDLGTTAYGSTASTPWTNAGTIEAIDSAVAIGGAVTTATVDTIPADRRNDRAGQRRDARQHRRHDRHDERRLRGPDARRRNDRERDPDPFRERAPLHQSLFERHARRRHRRRRARRSRRLGDPDGRHEHGGRDPRRSHRRCHRRQRHDRHRHYARGWLAVLPGAFDRHRRVGPDRDHERLDLRNGRARQPGDDPGDRRLHGVFSVGRLCR